MFFQEEPCFNKGTCIDGINSYSCNCTDTGFEGQHCEINIDECMTNPCQNNAECNDLVNDYKCDCHPGYDGTCARPIEVSPFYENPLQITQVWREFDSNAMESRFAYKKRRCCFLCREELWTRYTWVRRHCWEPWKSLSAWCTLFWEVERQPLPKRVFCFAPWRCQRQFQPTFCPQKRWWLRLQVWPQTQLFCWLFF